MARFVEDECMIKWVRDRDDRVEKLIDLLCRAAGGTNDDPTVRQFDEICEQVGLAKILVAEKRKS